jgi:hypothetical protein
MSVNTSAMVARERFGAALQQVRLEARTPDGKRIKQSDVAKLFRRRTVDRVSRLERGAAWPEKSELDAMLRFYNADLPTRVRLETMLQEGQSIGSAWWTPFADEFPESLIEFVAYEDAASKIVTCAGNLLPGIVQTRPYTEAITLSLDKSVLTPHLMDRSAALRGHRRGVFEKNRPPSVEVVISEAALRQQVGGKAVMLGQLDALIADAEERGVVFRVIPFSASATLTHMFTFLEFAGVGESPIIAFDSMTGMTFRKSTREMREMRSYVDSLRGLSLPLMDSLDMVKTVKKELSRD